MKGLVFLFVGLTFVFFPPAQAQETFRKEWAAGVSGGLNASSVFFAPKVQQQLMMGYNGGFTVRWITEKNLGLQLEANFKQQGWNERFEVPEGYPNPETYPDYRYIRRMNYLELPFLTHIYFGSERVRFIFNMGPQIGLLIGESTEENLRGATPNKTNAQHTMAAEKKFAWGLCGGPGVEVRTGIGCFQLEVRYYYALGDFYNTRRQDVFSKASSQVFSAKLSYLIPFRR
ncbi:porin family protein [Tannerella sp.]|uniref:porin family protein n=1 Tax=Tannerella sp. TaxID=2382127 RepID=UPI0026DADE64|nr:porin family protein [Tannerella sp.]MDO4703242.1 porin family protein [Tannerella sp.]